MRTELNGVDGDNHSFKYTMQTGYDDINNLTGMTETLNDYTRTTTYNYDDDNRLTGVNVGTSNSAVSYDGYSRVSKLERKNGSNVRVQYDYEYWKNTGDTQTSTQLTKLTVKTGGSDYKTYAYTYDANGNIISVSDKTGTNTAKMVYYTYDSMNQLVREDNSVANKTWVYSYDAGGNILSKTEYAYTLPTVTPSNPVSTKTYTYNGSSTDHWGDLLTGWNGHTVTSDANGNITSDGVHTYTWQHGRQLAGATKGTQTVTFEYDANGMRTKKFAGAIPYTYIYNGDKLTYMTDSSNQLYFNYDANGLYLVIYNGATYYYVQNAQGDVIAITNASGTRVVEYTYDAWGNILSTTGSMRLTLGVTQPFRYRGYVYDAELGLYYLQSRYYDPALGRFICADDVANLGADGHLINYNLFVYCGNNPAGNNDSDGNNWKSAFNVGFAIAVVGVALLTAIPTGGGSLVLASVGVASTSAYAAANVVVATGITTMLMAASAGGKHPTDVGEDGERQAGIKHSGKKTISINGRNRIPDYLDLAKEKILMEVKNVKYISNTLQLKDYAAYAKAAELTIKLIVREETKVAKTVIKAGWEIIRLIK